MHLLEYAADDVIQLHRLRAALDEFGRAQFLAAAKALSQYHTQEYDKRPPVGLVVDLSFAADHTPLYGFRTTDPKQTASMDADLSKLVAVLPASYRDALSTYIAPQSDADRSPSPQHLLVEIIVDLHRPPVVRFLDESERDLNLVTSAEDIRQVMENLMGKEDRECFSSDNRIGIPGTLHRMSPSPSVYFFP